MALSNPRFSANRELAAAAHNNPPLKMGFKGEAVAILQQALIDLGFSMPISTHRGSSSPDGIYGEETRAIVSAFQRGNGLLVDGIAVRMTLQQLEASIHALSQSEQYLFEAEFRRAASNGGQFG